MDDERELRKSGWAGWDDCKADLSGRDAIIANLRSRLEQAEAKLGKAQECWRVEGGGTT